MDVVEDRDDTVEDTLDTMDDRKDTVEDSLVTGEDREDSIEGPDPYLSCCQSGGRVVSQVLCLPRYYRKDLLPACKSEILCGPSRCRGLFQGVATVSLMQ